MKIYSLDEIAIVGSGQGAPQSDESFSKEGKPFIRAGSLERLINGESETDCELVNNSIAKKYKLRLYPRNTILFAKSGMSAKIGRIYRLRNSSYVVNHLSTIIPNDSVLPGYLYYYFQKFPPSILIRDDSYPSISLNEIKKLKIFLPFLPEQERIVEILDRADALRKKRREQIALLDKFLKSTFLEMFGDPVTNPMGWEIVTIGDLVSEVKYGTSKKAGIKGNYPILRMNNIKYSGEIDCSDLKYINLNKDEEKKYLVKKNDILFNRTNSKKLVGKTAVYKLDKPMAFAGYLIRVKSNDQNNPEYISGYLNSIYGKAILNHMCKSIVGMANINAKELQKIRIPKPPLDLQNQFARIMEQVEATKAKMQASLKQMDIQFNALMQRAFKGEL